MKHWLLITITCFLATTAVSCAPRQIRPVSEIDPSKMLELVVHRRTVLEKGLSGILEADFRQDGRRFRGKAYIIAFPDGPFRLEIPGPMGSTMMVMVNDGQEVTAYYPGEHKAFLSLTDGPSINPYLPFPLPVQTHMLSALLMGTVPEGSTISETKAFLLESGETRLWTRSDGNGMEFTYLFTRGSTAALKLVNTHQSGLDLTVTTRKTPPYLPDSFALTFQDGTITGSWQKVAMFEGDDTVLRLNIPGSVPVTDLRNHP